MSAQLSNDLFNNKIADDDYIGDPHLFDAIDKLVDKFDKLATPYPKDLPEWSIPANIDKRGGIVGIKKNLEREKQLQENINLMHKYFYSLPEPRSRWYRDSRYGSGRYWDTKRKIDMLKERIPKLIEMEKKFLEVYKIEKGIVGGRRKKKTRKKKGGDEKYKRLWEKCINDYKLKKLEEQYITRNIKAQDFIDSRLMLTFREILQGMNIAPPDNIEALEEQYRNIITNQATERGSAANAIGLVIQRFVDEQMQKNQHGGKRRKKKTRRKRGGMEEPEVEKPGSEEDTDDWSLWTKGDYLWNPKNPKNVLYIDEKDWNYWFREGEGYKNIEEWKSSNPRQVRQVDVETGQANWGNLTHKTAEQLYNQGWRIYKNPDWALDINPPVVAPAEGGGKRRKKKTRRKPIRINPKMRGVFTKKAKRKGMSVQKYAKYIVKKYLKFRNKIITQYL